MSQTTVPAPRLSGPAQQLDDYLQQQMRKASAQVRLVDLFTSIMTLLAVFLGALFLIAVVDAWVLELKPWMRASALGLIIVSAIAYILIVIVPLSIRKINPVYAAKVVESARPDIKNGLINYLLLRSFNREEKSISQRVIELVGSRAANDISGVEVAGTVDKTNTIRIAMVLVTIVTVLGLYKVFSPKDPFQTFARVMAPFSDVARPARVRITDVTPGNTTVYFGQPMPVTARVTGRFDEESVFLVYSTTDGQVIDERVAMRPSESGDGTYAALLKTDERGIGHSLDYHIEAGDGESAEYSMTLKSTPMLSVDSIKYEPPAYTRLPEQTVKGTSEISALEGTLVTLNTVANTQLQSASVVLLNQRPDAKFDIVNTMSMTIVDSKRAECKFRLQLDNNRKGQRYSHYQLNLATVEGKTGEPAAPCPIRVIPDLAPEIQVLEPTDTEVSVPINSKIRFVIRSQDADFELSKISVVGNSSVYEVFKQDIEMPRDADLSGQVNVRFDLWPKKLKLREGETVMVTFSAFDNRCIASNNLPDPNRTPSVNYMVTVTPAIDNPPADKPEDEAEQGDKDKSESSEDSNPSGNQQNNPDAGTDKDKEDSNNENEDAEAENKSDPNDNDSPADSESGSEGEEGKESSPDGQSGDDSKTGDKPNDKPSSDSKDSSEAGKDGQPEGGTADDSESKSDDSKGGNAKDGSGGNSSPDDQGNSDSKSGEPGKQGNSDSTGTQSSSDSPAAGSESSTGDATPDGSEQPGQTGSGSQPGEPLGEDAAPGDIIEKINQIREQQEKSGDKSGQPDSGQPNQGGNKDEKSGNSSSQDKTSGEQNQSGSESDSSRSGDKSEPESADGGSKQGDQSNSGAGKEETQQNPAQDNKPSNEGAASNSKDAGEKGSSEDSPSSGGSGNEKDDDKKGSSEGGGESGDKPEDEKPKPDKKSGGGGGDDKKQQSSGESGSKDDSGSPKQSDPSQPSGNSKGKDGESGTGEPGDSGAPESGGSRQDGTEPDEEGSPSGGSPESGTGSGEQKGTPEGNSPGNPGDQPGAEGNGKESQQPAGSGNSPGDQPGESPSSQTGDGQSSDGTGSGDQGSDQQGGGNAGSQPGGSATGNSSGGNNQPPPPTNSANSADAANLEYTKKATDLALDYLTQQQVNPDPELLEKLNWTEDELRDFVKRWNELRQRAETGDAADKAAYDQTMRSLGIGPNKAEVQQTQVQQDKLKGYQEDGKVSNAPAGFRAFEKRRNRVDEKQPPR